MYKTEEGIIDIRLKEIMQADPVTFFLINMKNYLTKEQMKIVSDELIKLTTKSNGEILMDAIENTEKKKSIKIPINDSEYLKKIWKK